MPLQSDSSKKRDVQQKSKICCYIYCFRKIKTSFFDPRIHIFSHNLSYFSRKIKTTFFIHNFTFCSTKKSRPLFLIPNFIFFLLQLSNVVRRDGDCGEVRLQATNSASKISEKLTELIVEFREELSENVIQALERLREKHSVCLSDIPPHFGSNKNERLHREVYAAFKRFTIICNT